LASYQKGRPGSPAQYGRRGAPVLLKIAMMIVGNAAAENMKKSKI
jgi:hypothetical protein